MLAVTALFETHTWLEIPKKQATEIKTEAIRFQRSMIAPRNVAMSQEKPIRRNAVYRWTHGIAGMLANLEIL